MRLGLVHERVEPVEVPALVASLGILLERRPADSTRAMPAPVAAICSSCWSCSAPETFDHIRCAFRPAIWRAETDGVTTLSTLTARAIVAAIPIRVTHVLSTLPSARARRRRPDWTLG